ncbi:hypothetical protein QX25_18485 (plasmid) [Stutzerimonas stutzeri]|nr:hypothetical protein QX25_18485 [Stutzerimonas stutzeri]
METTVTIPPAQFFHRRGNIYRSTEESLSAVQNAFLLERLLEKGADYFAGGREAQEEAHDLASKLLVHEDQVLLTHLIDIQPPAAGSEALEGWERFPVSRPLPRQVLLVHEDVLKVGTGCACPRTGGAITVDGMLIDSNQFVWWKYAEHIDDLCAPAASTSSQTKE